MTDDLLMLPPMAAEPPLHRWGTVTQASPLRVQLDGDDEPLAIDPWDMAGPRQAGERVYCQLANRRVVIMGPGGKPGQPVDLTSYLDTSLWTTYGTGTVAAEGIRWGPLVFISGAVSPKTGNPWIGSAAPSGSQRILSGLPDLFRMRLGGSTADSGWPRQPMTGSGSWHVYPNDTEVRGGRVAASTNVATSTWLPFGIWGFAADSI